MSFVLNRGAFQILTPRLTGEIFARLRGRVSSIRLRLICTAALCVLVAASSACRSDPEETHRKHAERGDAYFASKEYREAVIEYRNAVAAAPNSARTRFKLAESYAALSQVYNALPEYVRAADLMPTFIEAQLKAGNLLLLSRQFEDAKTRARQVLLYEPNNASALLMLGNALAGLGQIDEAVAANARAVALDPKHAGMYLNLGTLAFVQGNLKESEAAFLGAVAAQPNSTETHLGLANFYWVSGRVAEGERALIAALKLDPSHVLTNQLLASLYVATGRGALAEPLLKTAASVANNLPTKLGLADYYVAMGRHQAALEILVPIAKQDQGFAIAKGTIALIEYITGRPDDAVRTLDELLKREPKAAGALALKAHIRLGERDVDAAAVLAEAAVAADQRSSRAHFARGMVQLAGGHFEEARKSFNIVLEIDPRAAEASVELAKVHLARREIDSAIAFADQAVASAPRFLDARLARLRTLIVRPREQARADVEMRALLEFFPQSAEVHVASGQLALTKGQTVAAKASFERALQLSPSLAEALERLVALDVRAGRTAEARRRVDVALERAPQSAGIVVVAGKTYAAHGDTATAERHLRRALELDPSRLETYTALAGLYLVTGRLAEAQREFIELAKRQPKLAAAPTMVGILCEAQGNSACAEDWYQRALHVDPRAATAANNLAWLYADRGHNLEAALRLAQTANAQLPSQPEVIDTLGWVYYKKDQLSMAIPTLERAILADSTNPIYRFHLGMVHAKRGEDRKARVYLDAALKLNPNFPGAAEARRVLAKLVY